MGKRLGCERVSRSEILGIKKPRDVEERTDCMNYTILPVLPSPLHQSKRCRGIPRVLKRLARSSLSLLELIFAVYIWPEEANE